MFPVPELPRWQQYLLLTGVLLAVLTCVCLRLQGGHPWHSLLPLVLPMLLWWPRPNPFEKQVYWYLSVLSLFGLVLGILLTAWGQLELIKELSLYKGIVAPIKG
jgi:hypothetical protein